MMQGNKLSKPSMPSNSNWKSLQELIVIPASQIQFDEHHQGVSSLMNAQTGGIKEQSNDHSDYTLIENTRKDSASQKLINSRYNEYFDPDCEECQAALAAGHIYPSLPYFF
jgi:hypothetical protein